jgi:predicted amidohydrolase
MTPTTIATCAFEGSFDTEANLKAHHAYIDEAVAAAADLVVFPECSLHGYPEGGTSITKEEILRNVSSAESVTDGAGPKALIEHAADANIHVVFGMNEAGDQPGVIYNTAVLAGPEGFIGRYRKVHLGNSERMHWRHGSTWPVFDTAIGKIGLLICVDKAWPESTRELTLGGAEILVMPTAWPFVIGGSDARDRVRAAENSRWFVSSNFVGPLGSTVYPGYSQIIDPYGRVIATSEDRPGLVLATVDVHGGIAETQATWFGPRLIRERMPETYVIQAGLAPVVIDG